MSNKSNRASGSRRDVVSVDRSVRSGRGTVVRVDESSYGDGVSGSTLQRGRSGQSSSYGSRYNSSWLDDTRASHSGTELTDRFFGASGQMGIAKIPVDSLHGLVKTSLKMGNDRLAECASGLYRQALKVHGAVQDTIIGPNRVMSDLALHSLGNSKCVACGFSCPSYLFHLHAVQAMRFHAMNHRDLTTFECVNHGQSECECCDFDIKCVRWTIKRVETRKSRSVWRSALAEIYS